MSFNNGAGNSGSGVGGGIIPPYIFNNNNQDNEVKLNEDSYDIYVNGDHAGKKSLKNQGEHLSDIDDFLKQQGISEFVSSLDGDHYRIRTEGHERDIKDALEVYFHNR